MQSFPAADKVFAGVLGGVEDVGAGAGPLDYPGMTVVRTAAAMKDDSPGYDCAAQCDPRHVGTWRGGVAVLVRSVTLVISFTIG